MDNSDTDRLLVPYDDAMHQLGDIGRTTLHMLFERGDLVRVRIGRRGFCTAKSLAEYVSRLSETAGAHVDRPQDRVGAGTRQRTGDGPCAAPPQRD